MVVQRSGRSDIFVGALVLHTVGHLLLVAFHFSILGIAALLLNKTANKSSQSIVGYTVCSLGLEWHSLPMAAVHWRLICLAVMIVLHSFLGL